MTNRLFVILGVVILSFAVYSLWQPDFGGGGFLELGYGGTVDVIGYKESTSSFSIGIQGDEEDSFRNTDCLTTTRAKCGTCKAECEAYNAVHTIDKDCGTSNGDACYSSCNEDKCEDDHQTIYSPATTTAKTYFGKSYNCVQAPITAMSGLSFALDSMENDHDQIIKGYGTVDSLSLSWTGKGSITWSYPCIPTGTPSTWGSATKALLTGNRFNGIAFSTCSLAGWDVTNIQYVASDNTTASIKTLTDSGYFTNVKGISAVLDPAAKPACLAACPLVTAVCTSSMYHSQYDRCVSRRAAQRIARNTCLAKCVDVYNYTWSEDGVIKDSLLNPYATQQLRYDSSGDTILLFKDPTARIYSVDKDFTFLADMRGGTANTLLCSYIPPRCGDGVCNGDEKCRTCEDDCGVCDVVPGDGYCDPSENCLGSATDCICSDSAVCDPRRASNSTGCFEITTESLATICTNAGYLYSNTTCGEGYFAHQFAITGEGLSLEASLTGQCCELAPITIIPDDNTTNTTINETIDDTEGEGGGSDIVGESQLINIDWLLLGIIGVIGIGLVVIAYRYKK